MKENMSVKLVRQLKIVLSVVAFPFRGRHTAQVMTPATMIISILSSEEHHQPNSKSVEINRSMQISLPPSNSESVINRETSRQIIQTRGNGN